VLNNNLAELINSKKIKKWKLPVIIVRESDILLEIVLLEQKVLVEEVSEVVEDSKEVEEPLVVGVIRGLQ
jgi:uncharacterized protein (UPF0216 family)